MTIKATHEHSTSNSESSLMESPKDSYKQELSNWQEGPFVDNIESELVGSSEKMKAVFEHIHRLSHIDSTVLIRGENGTGKELAARMIYQNSHHKYGKFIAINCATLSPHLLEIELFGQEKGTFTDANERKIGLLQLANRGVLFLNEIGDLHIDLQDKLLYMLENKKFTPVNGHGEIQSNVRIIAATNRNLEMMIEKKIFRKDLFYRLNIIPISMPSLRERIEDLEDLVKSILKKNDLSRKIKDIHADAFEILKSYRWPGNVSELKSTIERAVMVEDSEVITLESIPKEVRIEALHHVQVGLPKNYTGQLDFNAFKIESEKNFIVNALKASGGKINQTVIQANIPKNTLLRKIKKYNIDVKKYL